MAQCNSQFAEEAKNIGLDQRSKHLRLLVIRGLHGAGKGHVGSALSLIEIVRILYDDVLNYKPDRPDWPERDRFILSKGHGCLGLYAVLADKGFFAEDELSRYSLKGSRLGGCCEIIAPGIEATTGALGHGLSVGVGMALAAKLRKRQNKIYVLLGDGELGEGAVWEGALCASRHQLDNLVTIIDYNKVQLAGLTKDISSIEPLTEKWKSFGFKTTEVNGHDIHGLRSAFERRTSQPQVIICHTVKGKGLPFAEGSADWHWKNKIDDELISKMRTALEGYGC